MYSVGMKLQEFATGEDGGGIAIDGEMFTLFIALKNPSLIERKEFCGKDFEIRIVHYQNIIIFPYRFGKLNWGDFCYNPHISEKIDASKVYKTGEGMVIIAILIDSTDGTILNLKVSKLSTFFSNTLNKAIREEQVKNFDVRKYVQTVNEMWNIYGTKQLVERTNCYCKINEWTRVENIIGLDDMT